MVEEINNNEIITETGDTTEDLHSLKRILATTEWVTEAQQIPLEQLENDERNIVIKCINKQEMPDCEIDRLEEILGRYRQAIRTQKPNETIQAIEDNIQHIQDCDTFLEKLEEVRTEAVQTIPFNLPTQSGFLSVELDVYPITDSTLIMDPNSHFVAFMDQTTDITPTREDTPEAQQIQDEIQKRSQEIAQQNSLEEDLETVIELLSQQTSLAGQPRNPEKMEKIYRAMPLFYLAALSQRVQDILIEPVYSVGMDKVFQKID